MENDVVYYFNESIKTEANRHDKIGKHIYKELFDGYFRERLMDYGTEIGHVKQLKDVDVIVECCKNGKFKYHQISEKHNSKFYDRSMLAEIYSSYEDGIMGWIMKECDADVLVNTYDTYESFGYYKFVATNEYKKLKSFVENVVNSYMGNDFFKQNFAIYKATNKKCVEDELLIDGKKVDVKTIFAKNKKRYYGGYYTTVSIILPLDFLIDGGINIIEGKYNPDKNLVRFNKGKI